MILSKIRYLLIIGLLTVLTVSARAQHFSPDVLKNHVYCLASDSLQGRKPGTVGDSLARVYIAGQFKAAGLQLLGNTGFQEFEIVTGVSAAGGNSLYVNDFHAKLWEEYQPASFSSSGANKGTVVFAGFGLKQDADSVPWNDYERIHVEGKWVLILPGSPGGKGPTNSKRKISSDRSKVLLAKDLNAAGVLIVYFAEKGKQEKLPGMIFDKVSKDAGIPVFYITPDLANRILKEDGYTIYQLNDSIKNSEKTLSFQLKASVNGKAAVLTNKVTIYNVVGILEGEHPVLKNEYIVIGAHFDHLGWGGEESGSRMPDTIAVHNGADDNASGVASLFALASYFCQDANRPARSLIFVAFNGEEMGLLGSKEFVKQSPVPLEQISAMINFDMVGRMKPDSRKLSVSGTGTSPVFDSLLYSMRKGSLFELSTSPDGYGPSDHASFYKNDIPVLFFTTGAHDDYHTPFDDAEKLDYTSQADILSYSSRVIKSLANYSDSIPFTESGSTEENTGPAFKVTLGIIPDVASSDVSGLRVDGVRSGGPAQKGGILKGDIIVAMDGKTVTNVYDYMARLADLKAGQTTVVEVIRNGKKEVLLIQL